MGLISVQHAVEVGAGQAFHTPDGVESQLNKPPLGIYYGTHNSADMAAASGGLAIWTSDLSIIDCLAGQLSGPTVRSQCLTDTRSLFLGVSRDEPVATVTNQQRGRIS
jgi:hypothetical protein